MGLILLTLCIVHVHDKFTIVAKIWRPVHRIFMSIRREWNVKKSLTDAFTTFLLLSYIKILNVSFDLLVSTKLYNMTGDPLPNQYYLYYDAGTRGFHGHHTKYGVLAITMLLVFNIAPLLIFTLYPWKCFHNILNYLHCSARLHIIMDSFLGCYRIVPRDYRLFAAFSLLVRIGNLMIFSATLSRYYYPFGCALFIGMAALVTLVKPYKSPAQNTIDATLYLVFAFGYLGATAYALSTSKTYNTALTTFMVLSSATSIIYLFTLILYNTVFKPLISRSSCLCLSGREGRTHNTLSSDEDLFRSFQEKSDERTSLIHKQGEIGHDLSTTLKCAASDS
jgi:hypothetical protein